MRTLKTTGYTKKIFFIIFMIAFLCGILFANLFAKDYIGNVGILSDYFLNKYKYMEINQSELFLYVLEKRIVPFLILGTLGITSFGIILQFGVAGWFGFSAGLFLSAATMKYGFKGILLCIGSIFPQYLIYIPALMVLMYKEYGVWAELGNKTGIQNRIKKTKKQIYIEYLIVLILTGILIFLGVMAESYLNPAIFKKILKTF